MGGSGELDSSAQSESKGATLPAKVTEAQDFFVVGGPVQPDRPCYVRRAADDLLLETIAAQRFASVLAPRAMGKSSLLGRTIRRLRADGQLAAVIDLTQIGSRGESVDSARWHYSIAYRICRELRLKVDLQSWWQDKNLLVSEQRLVEFFWDIVAVHTTGPVTIFFDDVERAVDLPFAGELFAALHSCYMRRVSEPDFARVNFVVLGAAAPEQLCLDPTVSPFVAGRAIRLEEFTLAECAPLSAGLGAAGPGAEILLERIHSWTLGQPYLTQKLARGVARKGGRLADVDTVVHELFTAPGISREEPLLSHMRSLLNRTSPRGRQAVAVLGRLARGGEVIYDPAAAGQQLLHLAGIVSSDDNGMLRFRNRIVEEVFGEGWVSQAKPRRWQRPAAIAAAALGTVVLVPLWYTQVLPQSDMNVLSRESSSYAELEQAHRRLGRLPGFGSRADQLLAAATLSRGSAAQSITEIQPADALLRTLPDGAALADELMAGFWLRRSALAAGLGNRDNALVYAIAAVDAGSAIAPQVANNLIDGDYRQLERSYPLGVPPLAVAVDWQRNQILVVDETNRVQRLPLTDGESRTLATRLTALQHVGVTRGVFVDESGRAGSFNLQLTVEHARSEDLLLRLRAPSGIAAEIGLPQRDGELEQFVFTASADNGLARLSEESITGQWELTLFDRLSGESGRLLSWGLAFPVASSPLSDAPVNGLPLPDPVRTEQIDVDLTDDGRFAVAIPARADARGAVSVWDLTSGALLADLPLADRAAAIELLNPDRLLVVGARRVTLWAIAAAEPLVDIVSAGGIVGLPAISSDGGFFAFAEPNGDGQRISLFRVEDGTRLSSLATPSWQHWVLGPDASYIAGLDGSRRGTVRNPLTGETVAEFFHERELAQIFPTAAVDRIVAVDQVGDVFAWPFSAAQDPVRPRDSIYLGTTTVPGSITFAGNNRRLAYPEAEGLITVRSLEDGSWRATLEHGAERDMQTHLAPAADRLVTVTDSLIRFWQLPAEPDPIPGFGEVSAVALDSRGEFAALGYRGGQVGLLPGLPAALTSGGATGPVTGHRGVVTSLAVNASGDLAASGSSDGVVRVWNTRTGARSPYVLRHPSGPIGTLAFSPDDHWLVSTGLTSARVFDLEGSALASEIEVDGTPLAVAFSADNRLVAIGDSAGNIFIATPDGSAGVLTIRGRAPITALAFATEPELLASGSSTGDLVLWDTLTASAIEAAHRFPAAIRWIDLLPGATEIHLQSGAWLHTLDRRDAAPRISASALLPDRLRGKTALVRTSGAMIRGLASAGGGRLALADIALAETEMPAQATTDPLNAAPPLPARNWQRVLGIELDPQTGAIRQAGQAP